jgi:hypothetical protein
LAWPLVDEKAYPQMTLMEGRWRTVFICVPSAFHLRHLRIVLSRE